MGNGHTHPPPEEYEPWVLIAFDIFNKHHGCQFYMPNMPLCLCLKVIGYY